MAASCQQSGSREGVPSLAQAIWPPARPGDSESQRRKKFGVRSGHGAMAAMVLAAVLGTVAVDFREWEAAQLVALGIVALLSIGWNLVGTRGAVGLLLSEADRPASLSVRRPWGGPVVYFTVQLALAAGVYWMGDRGRVPNLLWLALLPPVAYSVFLLEWPGITGVTLATLAVFLASVVRWHGWVGVPYGLLAFSFALLFTLVFTLLIMGAERARSEVQTLAAELGSANAKLREYAVQVEELAVTRERNRLAREIHDSLGHYLTVVHVQIQAAQALRDTDPARSQEALSKARALIQDGLRDIRTSVATLRASPLDNRQLAEALAATIGEHRASGLDCRLTVRGSPRPLEPAAALTLYRAGQEGLTNVRKHSRATQATLTLDFEAEDRVSLGVTDNGIGGAAEPVAGSGFGLLGLRERAQLLGGRLRAGNAGGGGFLLEVEVPG